MSFNTASKLMKRKGKKRSSKKEQMEAKRAMWREKGPVWFMEHECYCVKEGTLIFDGESFIPIENAKKTINRNGQSDEVIQHFKRPYNGKIINIKIKTMLPWDFGFTPEHPILAIKRSKHRGFGRYITRNPEWVFARDLKRKDLVLIPKIKYKNIHKTIDPLFNTKEKMFFLGVYVAEGCSSTMSSAGNPTRISIYNNNVILLKKLKKIMKEYNPKITRDGKELRIFNTKLASKFANWFGKTAKRKKIPDFIIHAPKKLKKSFLDGFIEGDGHISKKRIQLFTSSETLAKQFYIFLWFMGILPYVRYREREKKYIGYKWISKEYILDIPLNPKNYTYDEKYFYVPIESIKLEDWSGMVSNIETVSHVFSMPFITHNCPPNVPPHPDLGKRPKYCILSDDEKELLNDLWANPMQGLVTASRGAGKTYTISGYSCWRVASFDWYEVSVMGGSARQSTQLQEYIDYWRLRNPDIDYCIPKSVHGAGNQIAHIKSRWGGVGWFLPCSLTSSKGLHVKDLILDEVTAAEAKSEDGRKAIRAVLWQITGTEDTRLVLTSTSDFIFGTFYDILKNPKKYHFKIYRWSIAQHISPTWYNVDDKPNWEFIDSVLYKDRNPDHWLPNVWWVTQEDISNLRRNSTDDEWLTFGLGGVSRGSGLIYNPDDLDDCICKRCEVCLPWNSTTCPLMKELELTDNVPEITQRIAGVDFGGNAPNALTIIGKHGNKILVLHADEKQYLGPSETLRWIMQDLRTWQIWTVMADPEERAMIEALEMASFVCPDLWAYGGGVKKAYYLTNAERWIEKHQLIIPKRFTKLIDSISQMSRDTRGKAIKHNDHLNDALIYSLSEFPFDHSIDSFWEKMQNRIDTLW